MKRKEKKKINLGNDSFSTLQPSRVHDERQLSVCLYIPEKIGSNKTESESRKGTVRREEQVERLRA